MSVAPPPRAKISGIRASVFGDVIFVDHCEIELKKKKKYVVLLVLDGATNLLWATAQNSLDKKETLVHLREWNEQNNSIPNAIVGDEAFFSDELNEYYKFHGIKALPCGPRTPWPHEKLEYQLYGYQSDGPYDIPEPCRLWAREDEEAINFKDQSGRMWLGASREKSNNQIISSRAIDPKGEGSEWNMPLPPKQTIVTALWYNPRKLDESSSSTRSKRSSEVSEQDPQAKRLEIEPRQGQKRPALPGGESQPSRESRAVSAQASQGVKRRAEDDDDSERIRDLPDVEKGPIVH